MTNELRRIKAPKGRRLSKHVQLEEELVVQCEDFCEYYHMPFCSLIKNALRHYFLSLKKNGMAAPAPEVDGKPRKPRKK